MRAAGVAGQGFGHGGSRWFNLAEERQRFDPKGEFVVRWVKEIKSLPAPWRHTPWAMPPDLSSPLDDYPSPPDTPSKYALDGSGSPHVLFPELFSTTRPAKIQNLYPRKACGEQPLATLRRGYSSANGRGHKARHESQQIGWRPRLRRARRRSSPAGDGEEVDGFHIVVFPVSCSSALFVLDIVSCSLRSIFVGTVHARHTSIFAFSDG